MNHNMSNDGFSGAAAAGDGACGDVCGGAAELGGAAWSGEADAASGASAMNSVALITGVSRRGGIGFAIARRLAEAGFDLVIQHWVPHDADQPWGSDDIDLVVSELRSCLAPGRRLVHVSADFSQPDAPEAVVGAGMREFEHVDVLVANHAMSGSDGSLDSITAADLDHHWAVNTRSSILLAAAVAQVRDPGAPGRIVFMTSGQDLGPLPGEIAYGASKAALAGITKTIAYELAPRGFTVNCVNPGPVDSDSYVTDGMREALAPLFPFGRWGLPDDAARLVAWLVSEDGRWVTGQVINSEGGFMR